MRILVWGLGYVGTVSAMCLVRLGHEVVGIETNQTKVDSINHGLSPIKEPGLQDLVQESVTTGQFRATANGQELVSETDMSLICVGTPSSAKGSPQMGYVEDVTHDIGVGLQKTSHYHVVVLRSTVFPGTSRNLLCGILEKASGKKVSSDFGLAMNPEFLREGSAIKDFEGPAYTIIGEIDQQSGEMVDRLYKGINAPVKHVSLEEAELLKIVCNAFHALKVSFANEIGRLCDRLSIDSHRVMDLVCSDFKLNISPAYLRPGFAFGGSCLPKDLRFLTHSARGLGVEVPILDSILPSNYLQITAVRIKIQEIGAKRVGILGLSFKPGIDDLRESPVISLIRDLWQDGIDVLVYDPDINPRDMLGSNRAFLERQLPQINSILSSRVEDIISQSEVVVVSQKRPEFLEVLTKFNRQLVVLDLVRITEQPEALGLAKYGGLSW